MLFLGIVSRPHLVAIKPIIPDKLGVLSVLLGFPHLKR